MENYLRKIYVDDMASYNNINKYNVTIEELNILFDKCAKLNQNEYFADKLKHNELQEKIDGKRVVLYLNIDKKIHDKAASLNIYDGKDTFTIKTWNNREIIELKDTFTEQETPEIFKYLNMYVDFKESINKYHLSRIFFADLNDLLEDTIKFFTGKVIKKKVQKPTPLPPQQSENSKTEPKETARFKNYFDNIEPNEIYKHFKNGLVDKGYLTEQELNEYLKAAFELKTKPETLFKLKHTPTKQKIYTVFYTFYKDIAQKKHNSRTKYAALLGDFFEGYKTEIIQTNWAREYKVKR